MRRIVSLAALAAMAAAGVFGYAVYLGKVAVPDRWNPWTPLDTSRPPGPLTAWKLWRLKRDPELCRAALALSGAAFRPVPDSETQGGCKLRDAVRLERTHARYGSSFLATCPLAVGIALFDEQVLQPAARASYGKDVARIEHVGSYACRNVNHAKEGTLSQHASANAFDITGFVLDGGHRVTVPGDWRDEGRDGAFLRQVHQGACGIFNTTLGPDYNALHASHFHVDMGFYRMCR